MAQSQSQQQPHHATPPQSATGGDMPTSQQHQQEQQQQQQQQQPSPNAKTGATKKATANQKPSTSTSQNLVPDQWVCVLCRKTCHYRGLGDLYGPYHIDFSPTAQANQSQMPHQHQQQNEKSSKAVVAKKNQSRYSLLNHSYAVKEIWIHEDCLVWSEGVHLVGKKILKMDDTIRASLNHNCAICKTKGATIGCAGARCRRKFHYICGRDTNCLLDEANFTLKCDKCLANTAASLSLSINR